MLRITGGTSVKIKKKNETTADIPEKGAATQEMEAIMDAAAADTAEIALLLDDGAPTEEPENAQTEEDLSDGIDDIPDAMEMPAEEGSAADTTDTAVPDASAPTEEPVATGTPIAAESIPTAESASDEATAPKTEAEKAEAPAAPSFDAIKETAPDDSEEYKKLGLYLHVPFCKSKCAYCDFYSTDSVVCRGRKIPEVMRMYCTAIKNNMRIVSERTTQYNVDTVFIGGGTPTALPAKLLIDIVKEVERDFYLDEDCEFTVEMNPATAEKRLLKRLRRAGVNRLSIGLQSAHNHELAALSRVHTAGDFAASFQMAREVGFDNINIDVMFGIPEQTKETFMETLAFVVSMKPEHISMYNLRIEDGTPFGAKRHMLPLPDEDTECDMYLDAIAYLESQGYHQYEISNFARDGYECRHNKRYWLGEEYLGCGPAAHSYFGGRRFSLRRSLPQYCKLLETKGTSIPSSLLDESYTVDRREEAAEYLMLRFRLKEGISAADFTSRFGADFDALFAKKLEPYIRSGYMTHEGDRYAFTPRGMLVSNTILSNVIPFETKYGSGGKNG